MHPDELRQAYSGILRALTPLLAEAEAMEARTEALGDALAAVAARWPQLRRIPRNADANAIHKALQDLPDGSPWPGLPCVDAEAIREAISNVEDLATEAKEAAEQERRERLAEVEQEASELREQLRLSQPAERHAAE